MVLLTLRQWLGLLRLMRMLRPSVDFQFFNELPAKLVMRQHPFYGTADHPVGVPLQLISQAGFGEATRITRMLVIEFIFHFITGDLDLLGIDDYHKVARIHTGREIGLMFADDHGCDFGRQPAKILAAGIHYIPILGDLISFRNVCLIHAHHLHKPASLPDTG